MSAPFQNAVKQFHHLRESWPRQPFVASESPTRVEAAYRLIQLARDVIETAEGIGAGGVLNDLARRYLAETGAGSRFEQLRQKASEALSSVLGYIFSLDDDEPILEELFPRTETHVVEPSYLPGSPLLPLCRHRGFTNDGVPKPTAFGLQLRWNTLAAKLADLAQTRLELPILICGLEEVSACSGGVFQLGFRAEDLHGWLCESRTAGWRGGFLLTLCEEMAEGAVDRIQRAEFVQTLGHLFPGWIDDVTAAVDCLLRMTKIVEEAGGGRGERDVPGGSDRVARQADGPGRDLLVWYHGNHKRLSERLHKLLSFLWQPDKAPVERIPTREVINKVWGDEEVDDPVGTLNVAFSRLRPILRALGVPWTCRTVKGWNGEVRRVPIEEWNHTRNSSAGSTGTTRKNGVASLPGMRLPPRPGAVGWLVAGGHLGHHWEQVAPHISPASPRHVG